MIGKLTGSVNLEARNSSHKSQDTRYKQIPSTKSQRNQENQAVPWNLGDSAHFVSLHSVNLSLDPPLSSFGGCDLELVCILVSCILEFEIRSTHE